MTGATGFIGAHVVDVLLSRGLRVRGATRSIVKGTLMIKARPQYADRLEFVEVDDFERPGRLREAVKDVDAVIHVASVSTIIQLVPSNIRKHITDQALPHVASMLPDREQ